MNNLNTSQKINLFGQSLSALGCAVMAIFSLCVIGFCLFSFLFSGTAPKDYKLTSYVMCQLYVEKNLKAPSTAKFPASLESDIRQLENNVWEIRSYVDSQNSFGAMIRNNFYCKVQYVGTPTDDESLTQYWKLLDLQFDQ